jgi:predicted lipoprotein
MSARAHSRRPKWLVPAVLGAALLLLVVLNTKFVSAEEYARLNPPRFSADTYARKKFPKITKLVSQQATDIRELAPAVDRDVSAAGEKYGHDLGSGQWSFAVKAHGKVKRVDDDFVLLDVPDVPSGTEVRIPLGPALNGTPIRDCTGSIEFGDFSGQTDYQSVANQFKLIMQRDVIGKLDREGLKGKELSVEGAWSTGGPPKSYIIQPTKIEVRS